MLRITSPVAPSGRVTVTVALSPTTISSASRVISGTDLMNLKLIVSLIPLKVPVRDAVDFWVNVKYVVAIPFLTVILSSLQVPLTAVNVKSKLGKLKPS